MAGQDIVAEKLERSFGGDVVVDRVDLAVPAGDVFACVGPPGAGRTPLIRMLCGLLAPSGGKAKVAGFDISSQTAEVRTRVGAVLSGNSLDPRSSGREALRFLGRLYGMNGSLLESRVAAALELAGVTDIDNAAIATHELPVRRRLELAAALIHGPQVLFLDEATSGLDKTDAAALLTDVRDIQRTLGMTVFFATQATTEADQIADRVAIMDHGRIVAEGDLSELKASVGGELIACRIEGPAEHAGRVAKTVSGVQDVVVNGQEVALLTTGGGAVLTPLAAAFSANGVVALEMSFRRATLDDVFVELTGVHLEGMGGRATMAFPAQK